MENIRKMRVDDLDAVADLCDQLGYEVTHDGLVGQFEKIGEDLRHGLYVACDSNDRPIGWMHVWELYPLEAVPMAQVSGLVVSQEHRRRGIGQALMNKAEEWAKGKGFSRVTLRSRETRSEAHRFY